MSELEDIFNAFDDYEDAQQEYILDEVNYKIQNPHLLSTDTPARNNSKGRKLVKTRMKLFDNIRTFVSASQNRMAQNRMTQNRMTQNNPKPRTIQNRMTQNNNPNLTIIERRRQNETRRKEKQSKEGQRKETQRKVRFNKSLNRKKSIEL